jgi:aminoglycoside phosphotransferase (APT) family kinase protein
VVTEADEEAKHHVEDVAATLGLSIVRSFAQGTYGAVLVATASGEELVLKTQPDLTLEPVWTVGAEMAARLHDRGYPNPRILQVGSTGTAVWSLQERLGGQVLRRLTVTHAAQLIALARRHDMDSGRSRPWREDAIAAARRWLDTTAIDPTHARVLAAAVDRGHGAEILQSTIVHGDFHHANALVEGDEVVGVFDWDIAGPGDWRFDLVMLAFGCLIRPEACEPAAAALVTEAVRSECPDDVAALMMACQVLRLTSMIAARSADAAAAKACGHMVAALDPWLR